MWLLRKSRYLANRRPDLRALQLLELLPEDAGASGFAICTNGESAIGAVSIASTCSITDFTLPFGAV